MGEVQPGHFEFPEIWVALAGSYLLFILYGGRGEALSGPESGFLVVVALKRLQPLEKMGRGRWETRWLPVPHVFCMGVGHPFPQWEKQMVSGPPCILYADHRPFSGGDDTERHRRLPRDLDL